MPNRLASANSPYLLQHANNPVDWQPWDDKALEQARREDKPIFLSIGYSACHWCHVMEHESFENAEIAKLLNDSFVCIKVDREERPDLDQIYMNAVQMMTGRGGWPMSVFLTPDARPFYGGTYWPPHAKMGMPGFDQILQAVTEAWANKRDDALAQATNLTEQLQAVGRQEAEPEAISGDMVHGAVAHLERVFDFAHGGFGGAPKFPHPMDLRVLLRSWHRNRRDAVLEMVTLTLDKMAGGGMYDQLGGGFHRYSVDERWLVPHFEKMLYDNALLAVCYLEAYQATGHENHARTVRETLDFWLTAMTDDRGGFYSTLDADSEGVEGKFYVWTPQEVESVLGADAARTFCYVYDVSPEGNFEGQNILNLPKTLEQCAAILKRDVGELRDELDDSRRRLLAVREGRILPGLDDKVLVSWNGLMIDALAQASAVLAEPRYEQAATKAAEFLLTEMQDDDGKLLHVWRQGQAHGSGFLDDYACLANALITLFEVTFDGRWMDEAVRLCDALVDRFADPEGAGFFYTADDHEQLIARNKDIMDASVPSGNAMAATVLVRLANLTGRDDYRQAAEKTLRGFASIMERAPSATGQLLVALDMHIGPTSQIVLVGSRDNADTAEVLRELWRRFIPNRVLAGRDTTEHASPTALEKLFAGKKLGEHQPTVYVCEAFTCAAPTHGKEAAIASWDRLSGETKR